MILWWNCFVAIYKVIFRAWAEWAATNVTIRDDKRHDVDTPCTHFVRFIQLGCGNKEPISHKRKKRGQIELQMVFYFTSTVVSPPFTIFMGAEKHESEYRHSVRYGRALNSILGHLEQTKTWSNGVGRKMFGFTWTKSHRPTFIFDCNQWVIEWHPNSQFPIPEFQAKVDGDDETDIFRGKRLTTFHRRWSKMRRSSWRRTASREIKWTMSMLSTQCGTIWRKPRPWTWAKCHSIGTRMCAKFVSKNEWMTLWIDWTRRKLNRIQVNRVDYHCRGNCGNEFPANQTIILFADFRAEKEKRDANERDDKKRVVREQKEREREAERKRMEDAELRSYSSLMNDDKMKSNYDDGNDSDDFM